MPSILIIDDSETIRHNIRETLDSHGLFKTFHEAGDGVEGFKALIENRVDIILCDLEMPRMDGFKFLAMLATREELRDIPVIMLTSHEDRDFKVRGLEQGASDYITKPFDPGELVARVKVHLKLKTLQDQLKRSNELLTQLSNTDHLTGLYNRRFLVDALGKEFQRASRKQGHLSLVMLDIDYFKRVNDTYGHQAGDAVLVALAGMVRQHLRSYDVAARYGGEEFLLVLPEATLEESVAVAERLRHETTELAFDRNLRDLCLTISLGVAAYPDNHADSMESLIWQADEALYQAKQNGRNRVETYKAP